MPVFLHSVTKTVEWNLVLRTYKSCETVLMLIRVGVVLPVLYMKLKPNFFLKTAYHEEIGMTSDVGVL